MPADWPSRERLEDLAGWAARTHWSRLLAYEDRWQAAWDGLTEAVIEGDPDLHGAALRGISGAVNRELSAHGLTRARGPAPRYAAYWHVRDAPPAFEAVEETMTLAAVLAAMRPGDRAALRALADADGELGAAAETYGLALGSYRVRVCIARQRARDLWFAPESPPRRLWKRGRAGRR